MDKSDFILTISTSPENKIAVHFEPPKHKLIEKLS